jgi:hypothetical protein
MIKRAFGGATGVDDVIQAGACIALSAKQSDRGIHDRLSMPGNGGQNVLLKIFAEFYIEWSTSGRQRLAEAFSRERNMSDRITYRLADGVATIVMDDGKVNVMSIGMLQDLAAGFRQAEKDDAIIVLRSGRKDIFSAGFDLKAFAANDLERSLEMVKAGAELALRLMVSSVPERRNTRRPRLPDGNVSPVGMRCTHWRKGQAPYGSQ